jgi:hypothetical protein
MMMDISRSQIEHWRKVKKLRLGLLTARRELSG